jgi:threonine/homoserine/homoserine lactone efflux protein
MWAGELIWLTCALAGLSQLAQSFQLGFEVLRWLGVAYLGWMAWQMWRRPAVTEAAPMPRARSGASMFAAGLALTLGNPKIMVFYLALLPSLIDMDSVGLGAWAVLALVMLASLALVDFAWIALAQRARGLLRTPRAVRLSNRLGATAIGGAAAMIAVRG